MDDSPRILIAGVGNVLLTDDGIGVHAARQLQQEDLTGVEVVEIGTAILHGLHFLEGADRVLIIDAARGGQAPGTIYRFDAGEPTSPNQLLSVHAVGLQEAIRLLPPEVPPPAITVLGVEPESLDCGMNLSPRLQQVLPRVVFLAQETVAAWRLEASEELASFAGTLR